MSALQKNLLSACLRVLQPIVRILLKGGVTYKDFAGVSKAAFVKVARDDYGIRGRKTNITRVAILTGLSRKDCRFQVNQLEDLESDKPQTANPATRLISGWHQDADYCDAQGKPLVLPREGEISVESLSKRYAGDISHVALIKELQRVDAVEEVDGDRLRVVKRAFIPVELDAEKIRILANQLFDLGTTINFNVTAQAGKTRLQRYVVNERIPTNKISAFQHLATNNAQALLELLDDWLTQHEDPEPLDGRLSRTGLGVYFFEEPQPKDKK